ncbi:MAG: acylneuraminate cytidylyltransferase family protein [Gammaproteobacteria bacterium]|nr:acylneuraminate cytidylyltransferase family protein [Gammaproteobacteria bacterium]
MKILGLIPARGGSKGIPRKNLYPVLNKPLIAYTIEPALRSCLLSHVVVSTDDRDIAEESKKRGAQIPFIRPIGFAQDQSSALEVVTHAIDFYRHINVEFDLIVYLQPTSPLRSVEAIDGSIAKMCEYDADSLVSVMDVPHQFSVDSQMIEEGNYVHPVGGDIGRLRRQEKTHYVARNGPAILITSPATVENYQSLYGERTLSYKMSRMESMDIDGLEDIWYVEQALLRKDRPLSN